MTNKSLAFIENNGVSTELLVKNENLVSVVFDPEALDSDPTKSSSLLSFPQFIKDFLLKRKTIERNPCYRPFSYFLSQFSFLRVFSSKGMEGLKFSKVILSLGHLPDSDPGACFNSSASLPTLREVDAISNQADLILYHMQVKSPTSGRTSLDILKWDNLTSIISRLKQSARDRKEKGFPPQIHISLHSDFGIPNVKERALTLGIYYGSSKGKIAAERIIAEFNKLGSELAPQERFAAWCRHESSSPRGRLGIIRDIEQVSLIIESDFVSRDLTSLHLVQTIIAKAILNTIV